jgi:large subunit ribosomal protein L33
LKCSSVADPAEAEIEWRSSGSGVMREYVWLECTECGDRNYRVQKETRGAERLELKKYCKRSRTHTTHKESRKK